MPEQNQPKTRNTEHGTQNTEHRTQNTEHGTRNTKPFKSFKQQTF